MCDRPGECSSETVVAPCLGADQRARGPWNEIEKTKESSDVRVVGIGLELAMQWRIVRGNNIKKHYVLYTGKDSPYQTQLQASYSPRTKALPGN